MGSDDIRRASSLHSISKICSEACTQVDKQTLMRLSVNFKRMEIRENCARMHPQMAILQQRVQINS